MLRIHLDVEDITRMRLVAPSMCELSVSVQAMQCVGHPYRSLWRSRASRFPGRARRLLELVPARGDVPLFLAPEMADSIDEAVDVVLSTPASRIREELTSGRASTQIPPSSWFEDLCRGHPGALQELGIAMREYQDTVMTPLEHVRSRAVAAEMGRRTEQIATEGIASTLNALHPAIRWRAGVLEISGTTHGEVDISGRGLRLMPSVWPRPGVALDWREPTLVYPVPYPYFAAATGLDGAKAVLGKTRATVLQALLDQHSTTSLANALDIAPSSASSHTSALRNAGLVISRREGKSMVHSISTLGMELLTAAGSNP